MSGVSFGETSLTFREAQPRRDCSSFNSERAEGASSKHPITIRDFYFEKHKNRVTLKPHVSLLAVRSGFKRLSFLSRDRLASQGDSIVNKLQVRVLLQEPVVYFSSRLAHLFHIIAPRFS